MNIDDFVYKKSGRGYKVEIQCLNCEEEFWVRWSVVKSGGGKYCSYKCTNEHRYYSNTELKGYETRVGDNRHIEVKIQCEQCGEPAWAKWQRVQKGQGRFCSLKCAGESFGISLRKNFGKENAAFIWSIDKGCWCAYWKEFDGVQTTTTKAKWLWETNYGDVPNGYVVTYKDRNPKNCILENLEVITRGERTSEALMGHVVSDETKQKLSDAHSGKTLSDEHKLKISNSLLKRWASGEFEDIHVGENSLLWRGGVDKAYPLEFSAELKEFIRNRDEHKCRLCSEIESIDKAFPVHHINGDKNNNNQENLLTVCYVCHGHIHGKYKIGNPVILAFRSMLQY